MSRVNKKEELVLFIYDKDGISIQEKIIEIFSKYILSNVEKDSA